MRDLVAVDLRPGAAFLDALRRAWDEGDAVLPLQQEAPVAFRQRTAQRLGATVVIDGSGRNRTGEGWPVDEGDALVVATSGTTGDPKGAVLTHDAVTAAAYATSTALGVADDTHWLGCLPLSHVGGLSIITRAWETGAALTLHDGIDPAAVDAAAAAGATHVSLVPAALARIDPTPWRRILLGGSAIPDDRPPNAVAGYGMTETFGGVVYDGLPVPGVQTRIAGSAEGQYDVTGPIEVRSPSLLRCYRDGTVPIDSGGWYRTGDLGLIGADDHHLRVSGRADDLIITGGEKVWPQPVEAALEQHPAVAEAAVVGVADLHWGQRVCAVVVPTDNSSPPDLDELRDWIRGRLPVAAAPHTLILATNLPRTSLGKLARSSLAVVAESGGRNGAVGDGG